MNQFIADLRAEAFFPAWRAAVSSTDT